MDRLQDFLATEGDGVFYVGHASFMARFGLVKVLFDPVWDHVPYGADWTFVPPQHNCDSVQVRHKIVSHIHEDHLCERLLDGPVYIMDGRPELEERLVSGTRKGSHIAFPPYAWCGLPNGLEVYFVPNPKNQVDSSCFVRSKSYCVYHGNDNFLSEEQLARLAQEVGPLDVAFVPYAFVHWYPHLMISQSVSERESETKRLRQQSLDSAARFIEVLKPKVAIPGGNSLFFNRGADHFLNKHLARPWDVRGAIPLLGGDYVVGHTPYRELRDQPEYEELLRHQLGVGVVAKPMEYAFKITDQAIRRIQRRVEGLPRIKGQQLVINSIVIDLENLSVRRGDPVPPFLRFYLDRSVYEKWLSREMTFEQVLGTRRFLASRSPNVYRQEVFEWMNRYL